MRMFPCTSPCPNSYLLRNPFPPHAALLSFTKKKMTSLKPLRKSQEVPYPKAYCCACMEAGVVAISFFFIRLVHLILAKLFDWGLSLFPHLKFVIPSIFVYRKVVEISPKVFFTSEKGVSALHLSQRGGRPCAH